MTTVGRVRSTSNSDLALEGVLLTMADTRTRLGQQVAGDARAHFRDKVYLTTIPRNVRLGEAPALGFRWSCTTWDRPARRPIWRSRVKSWRGTNRRRGPTTSCSV